MGNKELRRQVIGNRESASFSEADPRTAGIATGAPHWHPAAASPPRNASWRPNRESPAPGNEPPSNLSVDITEPLLPEEDDSTAEAPGNSTDAVVQVMTSDEQSDLFENFEASQRANDIKESWAVKLSLAANVLLLAAKLWAFAVSGSQAVLASTADSAVDLASQTVLGLASWSMRKEDVNFPIGKTRLETIGVIACAIIMGLASYEVLQSAAVQLYYGFVKHMYPDLDFGWLMYIVLGSATAIKVPLYFYCIAVKDVSASMIALAEDHRNDVLANLTALVTAGVASMDKTRLWMSDPIGAVLISLYIMWSWAIITKEQLDKLVGHSAPEEFLEEVGEMAANHHEGMEVDVVRAYHFGERYTVEVEVILPGDMTVRSSHDIALDLQHKIEALEDVERAHVHVDYQTRDQPEHKVDRNLNEGWHLNQPHPNYLHIAQGSMRSNSGESVPTSPAGPYSSRSTNSLPVS